MMLFLIEDDGGFFQVSQRGSHIKVKKFTKTGQKIIIVPDHRELTSGTFRNILQTANLSLEKFDSLR